MVALSPPTPRMVWGAIAAAGVAAETYGLFADTNGYTLSEVTREVFRTHETAGKVLFAAGWVGFSWWFVPHIVRDQIVAAVEDFVDELVDELAAET